MKGEENENKQDQEATRAADSESVSGDGESKSEDTACKIETPEAEALTTLVTSGRVTPSIHQASVAANAELRRFPFTQRAVYHPARL